MKSKFILILVLGLFSCKKEEIKPAPVVPTCECNNQKEKFMGVNVGGVVQMQWVIYYTSTLETKSCGDGTEYIYTDASHRNITICK
tara:strand:+ start:1155 stop:1412 length:258 start_codon:yes stop_codon:yes gene_type:complete